MTEDDETATEQYNIWIGNPEKALTNSTTDRWWSGDSFSEMAVQVLHTPPTMAFLSMADTLLPMAYRAMYRLLDSRDARGVAKGIELLLRSKGLLIDTVRTDDSETVNKIFENIRKMENVVTQGVYLSPNRDKITEGEFREQDS